MSCLDVWIFYGREIILTSSKEGGGGGGGEKYSPLHCTTLLKQKCQFSASLLWIVICKQDSYV